jgi:anti-sigma regulatory factor (Ser/Thr protein kinase)
VAPVAPVAPVGEAEATPDPEDPADGDLLYQVLGGLALRDLTLVESLLQVVEKLESNEQNPGQLELLFRIDHLATRMRRNSENLLVLAGHDPQGRELEPVPLLDVARAAVSEITDYSRVQISPLPDLEVMGVAADDLSHILAELLENATSKSPESAAVVIRAERTGDGTIVISVEDSGIGIPPDQLADLNARLSRAPVVDPTVTRHMGLYVVGRLAQRHGIRIQLRERPYGGLIAHVVTPARLVRTGPDAQPRPARGPATKPQPAVPPSGPRLTAVRSPHPGPPGTPGTPPQRERPAPPPAAAPGRPMTPPAPRFAPADPSMLPQRTPSRGAAAGPRPSAPPPSAPLTGPPLASPQPPAETPGTEAPAARADRIRDDLTDFRLGQNEARAAGRQNGTEAGPA